MRDPTLTARLRRGPAWRDGDCFDRASTTRCKQLRVNRARVLLPRKLSYTLVCVFLYLLLLSGCVSRSSVVTVKAWGSSGREEAGLGPEANPVGERCLSF